TASAIASSMRCRCEALTSSRLKRWRPRGSWRTSMARDHTLCVQFCSPMAADDLVQESRGEAPGRGRLEGRRILVVGGGQEDYGLDDPPIGNGRAMSILFAREGAAVAVADRLLTFDSRCWR